MFGLLLLGGSLSWAQDFKWPADGSISQCFSGSFSGQQSGYYYDSANVQKYFAGSTSTGTKLHRGIDIAAPTGALVYAARGGQVTRHDWNGSHIYGNRVVISHGAGYYTLYAHLATITVPNGAVVTTGRQIGTVGTTGASSGPHLHFEIRHSSDATTYYARYSHHIPCPSSASHNVTITFDYPGIGTVENSIVIRPVPVPSPGPATSPLAVRPDSDDSGPNGDNQINDTLCGGAVPMSRGPHLVVLVALVLMVAVVFTRGARSLS